MNSYFKNALFVFLMGSVLLIPGKHIIAQDNSHYINEGDISISKRTSMTYEELKNLGCVKAVWGVSDDDIILSYPENYLLVNLNGYSDVLGSDILGEGKTEKRPYLVACTAEQAAQITETDSETKPDWWQLKLIWFLNGAFSMGVNLAIWILWLCSFLLTWFISIGSFVTNPMVQAGWPVVQGFANLGFILALLFIAFAFTLRLDQFQPKRFLPRLLAAALLINFSLVIGGIIIDASRLAMAVLVRTVTTSSLTNLGTDILKQSGYLSYHFYQTTAFGVSYYLPTEGDSWSGPINVLKTTILAWGLVIGMAGATIGFLIRYIMLILLLIASPAAYLAIAIPGADGLARKWWTQFIAWVLFGPIALLILILATVIGGGAIKAGTGVPRELSEVLNIIISIALMLAAASAGKIAGMAGAGEVLNTVKGKAKSAAQWTWNNPKTVGTMVAGPVGFLGAIGAQKAYKGVTRPVRSLVKSWEDADKKTEEEKMKKSWGTKAYNAIDSKERAKTKEAKNQASDLRSRGVTQGNLSAISRTSPTVLRDERVGEQLTTEETNNMTVTMVKNMKSDADRTRVTAVLNNDAMVEKMSDATKQEIYNTNDEKLIEALHKAERRIKDKKNK